MGMTGSSTTYRLEGKSTTSKLLKGAKRESLTIDKKKTCIMINFSDGAYKNIALALIEDWRKCQEEGETFKCGNRDLSVSILEQGFDEAGNHIDSKIVFIDNN